MRGIEPLLKRIGSCYDYIMAFASYDVYPSLFKSLPSMRYLNQALFE